MDEPMKKIYQGLNFASEVLNALPVRGSENCRRVASACGNLEIIAAMIAEGRLRLQPETEGK